MLSENLLTINDMNDILNKPLYFFESGRLNVSNSIHPDDLGFFEENSDEYYSEIVVAII